jgi:serine phosphatase RsbU (regulator of sigma subunit)
MAYDAYVQSLALKRREVFFHQAKLAHSLETIYGEYRNQLKELGVNFSKDKALQSLSGSRKTRLWFNLRRGFFKEDIQAKSDILLRAYFRQQKAWKTQIWKSLKLDPTQYNDWKSPIKCQIFVWEQAILDPDYSTSHYDPTSFKPKRLRYRDLRPAGFESKDKPVNQIYRERGFYSFIRHFPCHPVFVPRELLMRQIWNSLYGIVRDLLVITLLGRDWFDGGDLQGFEAVTGTDIVARQKQFIPFHFPGISLDLYWDYLPVDFDLQEFRKNNLDAPEAMYLFVFDHSRAKRHFMGLVMGRDRTPFLSNISSRLDEFEAGLEGDEISLSVLDLKKGSGDGEFSIDLNYEPGEGYKDLTLISLDDGSRLVQSEVVDQLIGFLNHRTGGYSWQGEDLIEFLAKVSGNQEFDSKPMDTISSPDLKRVLQAASHLGRALTFTYTKKDSEGGFEDRVATIYPSSVFKNKGFLFSQSLAGFQSQVLKEQTLLVAWMLLAAGLVIFLGNILSRKLVTPVLELSERITGLASGKYEEQLVSIRHDEVGDLVSGFNSMAENINEKLFELRAIGTVNLLMTHDYSREIILKYILHLLCIRYGASFGFIGFFEDRISMNPGDYQLWDQGGHTEQEMESQVGAFLPELGSTRVAFQVLDESSLDLPEFKLKNLVSCYSDTGDPSRDASVCGVLLLGGLPHDSMADLEKIEGSPIIHLCEQAKTVVLKGLLDEIEADTIKGQQVQEGLMPAAEPETGSRLDIGTCFTGARGLAGDYYDYLSFKGGDHIGFCVADVSGKGVGPALFGASARAHLKLLAESKPRSPGEVLRDLNQKLCETQDSSLFLTIFYAVFDLRWDQIFFASAGHNKMLLVRANGSILHLSAKGVPVGVFAGQEYETRVESFAKGDSLVLYTDGVTELENASQELYGLARFETFCRDQNSLSSKPWTARLWGVLDEYRDGVPLSDDVTCVRILVKG